MRFILNSILGFLFSFQACAQTVTLEGLWLIEKVQVGNQEMTPDSKWVRFDSNGAFEGGNGYLMNSAGTYTYNSSKSLLTLNDNLSLENQFGGFHIEELHEETMIMQREEQGQQVRVQLRKINKLQQR